MKPGTPAPRSALLPLRSCRAFNSRRASRRAQRLTLQRTVAFGMALLLLPLAQIDALAQEQLPQPSKPSPYHYAQPDTDSAPQQPADPVRLVYPTRVNNSQQLPKKPVYQAQQPPQKPVDQAQVQYPPQPAYQAQQLYPQQPGYPSQPNPYYTQQQPAYPQQPGYQGQPYGQQPYPQQQYSQQAPAPQSYQDYADQGAYPDQNGPAQSPGFNQPPDQGFASQQLEQLVAPIALYPDTLVAQILAAATYPAQVIAADHWLQSMGPVSQDQVAAAANAQSTWDPSVKALTAFPQVLAMMDRDLQWTTDLGNAYYNQPQDVLATIQVLRQRAQSAGTLRSTPQEQVSDDQGYIQLAPTNPQYVYVPSYNPWYAYGAPINPYPGFSILGAIGSALGAGLRFGAPIALGAFLHMPFGWLGWALNWLGSSIFFNHSPYYSHSTSVAHWGGYRGGFHGSTGGNYAGGRTMPSRPTPQGRESAGNYAGNSRGESAYGRASNPYENQRLAESQRNLQSQRDFESQRSAREAAASSYRSPEGYGRVPAQGFAANRAQNYAYARPAEPINRGAAGSYSGSYGRESSPYAYGRPAEPMRQQFSAPQQQYGRAQSYANPGYNSGGYRGQQSFANERAFAAPASRGFQSEPRYESSAGSHFFGGGHGESYHAPKAPKMSGGGGHGHSGGGGKHH